MEMEKRWWKRQQAVFLTLFPHNLSPWCGVHTVCPLFKRAANIEAFTTASVGRRKAGYSGIVMHGKSYYFHGMQSPPACTHPTTACDVAAGGVQSTQELTEKRRRQ